MLRSVDEIPAFAAEYDVPPEDVLLTDVNLSGLAFRCGYNRARLRLRISDTPPLFALSRQYGIRDFYLALAVRPESNYVVSGDDVLLAGRTVGTSADLTEDICDSNYPRRGGTVLNLNPNARTGCRGCRFCYTAYQVPHDRRKILNRRRLNEFFDEYLIEHRSQDLSHLVQVAVVTGCFDEERLVVAFLRLLRDVLAAYRFHGEIFYLGCQVSTREGLQEMAALAPVGYCLSIECFQNRREMVRDKKRVLSFHELLSILEVAGSLGIRTNCSYVLGLDPLTILQQGFSELKDYMTSFPIINLLQVHKYHPPEIRTPDANSLGYYLSARRSLETIFQPTRLRPRPWENYRSPWYLTFAGELLSETRTP